MGNYHLRKIGISTDTDFEFCAEYVETSILVLGQCPAIVQSKLMHVGGIDDIEERILNTRCLTETQRSRKVLSIT